MENEYSTSNREGYGLWSRFPHLYYSPDLTYSDYWLLADLKRICHKYGVYAETVDHFESEKKSFYQRVKKMLHRLYRS